MSRSCILPVRRAVSDVTVEHNKCRPALGLPENIEGVLDAFDIISICDPQNVPSISQEPGRNILRKRNIGIALDGDVVVVPDPAEAIEPKMACQRGGLRRYTFHHAAVATNRVDVVVEDVVPVVVITAGQPLPGNCHPYTSGYSLPERTSRGLDAGDPMILRMSRSFAVQLAKATNIIECHRRLPESF